MGKIKLNKDVFDALESIKEINFFYEKESGFLVDEILEFHVRSKWVSYQKELNKISAKDLATALLIGYELIESPEDVIKDKLKDLSSDCELSQEKGRKFKAIYFTGFKDGINFVLEKYNIKLDKVD